MLAGGLRTGMMGSGTVRRVVLAAAILLHAVARASAQEVNSGCDQEDELLANLRWPAQTIYRWFFRSWVRQRLKEAAGFGFF